MPMNGFENCRITKDCFRIIGKDADDWLTDDNGDYLEFDDEDVAKDYIKDFLDDDLDYFQVDFIDSSIYK